MRRGNLSIKMFVATKASTVGSSGLLSSSSQNSPAERCFPASSESVWTTMNLGPFFSMVLTYEIGIQRLGTGPTIREPIS